MSLKFYNLNNNKQWGIQKPPNNTSVKLVAQKNTRTYILVALKLNELFLTFGFKLYIESADT